MPKKTNLTANNLIYRPGWFPPIPDTESKASEYHGVQEFYKNQQNKEYFHKVLKENFGFDLEADPEDVKKRMIITSKAGKFAMEDYLKSMEDISLMPDSPEKMNKYHQAAGALEGVLYQQLAKGRLIFIPLGETEPRQFRYNPNVGEFQLSGPLKSLDQYRKVDEEFLPRDKKNNIIYQKKEKLLKPENPGEFKGIPPQKPQPIGPFREYLRDMPVMGELKPLREEPLAPKDPQEGGKTKQELIDEEFKRISSDVVKPEHRELKSPIPRFVLKAPVKYEKPEPPRDDLMKPVIPSVEKEIEKVDDQLKSLKEPVFPSEFKRVLLRKPDPVAEPYKPVLENPDPPDEPEYKAIPNEPIFKHPLEPKISIELPKFTPREEPILPKSPVLTDYPEKQAIRPEPVEPERPGFFKRFFSSASVRQWEARHSEWETDHNAWLNESSQANLDFAIRCAEVDRENNEKLQNYAAEVRAYVTEYELHKKEVEEYRKQVQDLEGINEERYDRFTQDKKDYEKVRKELGDQYDVDYQEFLEEHKKWEKTNQEIIKENERLKKEHENSPVYKKYVEDQKWYDTNMSAFAFDYKNLPTLKKQYMDEYENNLAKYKTYLQEEKAYQDAIKPVKEEIEADDKAKNGNNPDYEQNKEARINERLAANEKANLDYDKELKDYKEKLENLYDIRQTLIKSDTHVQYVAAQKAYERNEELRTRKVIVKKQAPVQSDFDYNIDYDQLDEEGKIRLGEKLDPIINSDEQFLPSEKRFEENSKAVSKKEDEKEKGAVEGDNEEISIDHDDNDALNYTFVEDEMMDSLKEGDIDSQENQANAEEKKNPALKEDEEEISLYEYEVRRFEAYEKDQKYYDLMKKRYDEKKAEYDREKLENDKWNDSLEEKLMEYDQHINKLHEVAENNVSQRIEGYKNQKRRYDEDHSKWVEEEKDYKEKKNKLETEYVLDNHKWKKEKEEYDKKKAEYDEKLNEYGDEVKYYNRKVQEYNAEYKDYVEKKRKYEHDVKMNEIIEARNREYEQEYNKIAAAYEKKVMDTIEDNHKK